MSIVSATNPHRVEDLERALEDVEGARHVAMQVLQLTDDPYADARKVAAAIEQDPIFVTQVLRVANSAAFGMARQVKATQIAVAILGFSTVRSMAVMAVSGLSDLKHPAPVGFWEHSASTAAACTLIARRYGISPSDGFAIGLIHDLGIPMLNAVDPVTYGDITRDGADNRLLAEREAEEFGMSHAKAAEIVLSNWQFPELLISAIGNHHREEPLETPESMLLFAGDALAHLALEESDGKDKARLKQLGFKSGDISRLVGEIGGKSGGILAGLLR